MNRPTDEPPRAGPTGATGGGGDDVVAERSGASVPAGALADLLRVRGVDEAEITAAAQGGSLALAVIEHLVLPDAATFDLLHMSEATGLSPELIKQMWRSLGFAEPRPGDNIFVEADVDLLRTVGLLLDLDIIDDELVIQMSRVIGSSASRVANALVDAVEITTEVQPAEVTDEGGEDEDISEDGMAMREAEAEARGEQFAAVAPVLFTTLHKVQEYVWRRHVQSAARARIARVQHGVDPSHIVVGFADLVGFTALSQQIDAHELATVVERFETLAYETVTRLGGRVVKMIGDEVMFAVNHERAALEIALNLADTYRNDDELSDVRVGLASGPVLQREADLYGPVVNMASRIVGLAFPGTVVCSSDVHEALQGDPAYDWKSLGGRKLKDIGREQLFVVRRVNDEARPRNAREMAEARRSERREARVTEMEDRRRNRRERSR